MADRREHGIAFLFGDHRRGIARDPGDIVPPQRIPPALSQILGDRICNAQGESLRFLVEGTLFLVIARRAEHIESCRQLAVEEVRFGEIQLDLLLSLGDLRTYSRILAFS